MIHIIDMNLKKDIKYKRYFQILYNINIIINIFLYI